MGGLASHDQVEHIEEQSAYHDLKIAQTKQSTVTSVGPNGSFYEPQARSRARAVHNYNEFGELESLNYYWDCPELTTTPSQLIASNVNAYDHLGRRTSTAYNYLSAWTETFGYATNLDYLTSEHYSDVGGTPTAREYDAAQNRNDVTVDILNRITGHVGNPNITYVHNAVGERTKKSTYVGTGLIHSNHKNMTWSIKGELHQLKSTVKTSATSSETTVSTYDYRYRPDGLRVAKYGQQIQQAIPEEGENSSFWDTNLARNRPTWRYAYDGQMPVYEDYTRYEGGQYLMIDATRSFLGGRGIDMIERQRMSDKNTNVPGGDFPSISVV